MGKIRRFLPGDEWLYLKIYASVAIQDNLLRNKLYTLVYDLYKKELITKFFFVRYVDKDGPHLRLRFHLSSVEDFASVVSTINYTCKRLILKRQITNISIETYVRELERYGEDHIETMESLFSINSLFVLNLFRKEQYIEQGSSWLILMADIDRQLDILGFSNLDKHQLYEDQYSFFASPYEQGRHNKEQLKAKYREFRLRIINVMNNQNNVKVRWPNNLNKKMGHSLWLTIAVDNANEKGKNRMRKNVGAFIHMALNRLFSHNQNMLEFVIYYMMSNHYKSCLVREKIKIIER